MAEATNAGIESLTLPVTNMISLQRLPLWNMILIGVHELVCCIMLMVKNGTYCHQMELKWVMLFFMVHCIELRPGKGAQLGRSAGAAIQLMAKGEGYAQIKLRSGEIRKVRSECMATVGTVGNTEHMNIKIGKAGRNRWLGHRPTVRGVVMNPVDHPHGGGEGKSSGGRHPVTPWGMLTKGAKTRKRKDTDKYILKRK